ncbi:MAG TPA: tol-pal system-associated acyl-CoA thioesterase [Steroidobacteraceae bacterium]|nr:tol-pal system-associated acyl-CoA thioesterase [Steroidobacteraceae bacterium]
MAARFEWPVRVYWEDTDAGGIVYHASYLEFLERARTEWLRALGIDQRALRATERLQFAVVDMQIEWRRAARYDDLLTVTAQMAERGRATLKFAQTVLRGAELLLSATVRVAAIDAESLRPRRLPLELLNSFE